MNRTNFKVGDRVRIVSHNSIFFGQTGVITSIGAYATRLAFRVRIDSYPGNRGNTFYEENLVLAEKFDEYDKITEKYASHDAKVLAEAYTRYYGYKRAQDADLAQALKIVINSIYGLTSAAFENPFRDPRNVDNKESKPSDFIVNVIFNSPATIVQWKDGTKTVVKACEGEKFDPEKGLAMAIAKKVLGNKGNYYEAFKKWLPEEDNLESRGLITIDEVTPDDITKIIDTRLPFGLFYCKDGKKYIGVDNIDGDAFTEEFKTKKACLEWLKTE